MVQKKNESSGMTPAALGALLAGDMGNFAAAMTPGGIEAQEAAGQRSLTAKAERLPIKGTVDNPEKRAQWEAAGFVFGEPITEGRHTMFVACTFPRGWKLVPTEHSMWSSVVDAKGRKRAAVFFKAAFYDYSAHTFGLESRYTRSSDGGDDGKPVRVGVFESGTTPVHIVAEWPDWEAYYKNDDREKHKATAEAWLAEHYPDHANPLAYWD